MVRMSSAGRSELADGSVEVRSDEGDSGGGRVGGHLPVFGDVRMVEGTMKMVREKPVEDQSDDELWEGVWDRLQEIQRREAYSSFQSMDYAVQELGDADPRGE